MFLCSHCSPCWTILDARLQKSCPHSRMPVRCRLPPGRTKRPSYWRDYRQRSPCQREYPAHPGGPLAQNRDAVRPINFSSTAAASTRSSFLPSTSPISHVGSRHSSCGPMLTLCVSLEPRKVRLQGFEAVQSERLVQRATSPHISVRLQPSPQLIREQWESIRSLRPYRSRLKVSPILSRIVRIDSQAYYSPVRL